MWQDKTKQMRTFSKDASAKGFAMIHRDELWNENACELWFSMLNEISIFDGALALCLARPARPDRQILNTSGSSMQTQDIVFGKTDHETGEVWKVTYEKDTLERLTKAIQDIAFTHGFGPVDARALLRTVYGVGEEAMNIPGPSLKIHNKYQKSHDHDFCINFLSEDRIFVRSLLEVIFCRSSFSARDCEAISLDEVVTSVEFDETLEKRKLEISYSTGLDEDDNIFVIIQGSGKEPNAFIFQHSASWVKKRLLASRKGPVSYRIEARD